jgi:gamma-glutamyltranspeptidase / glutathione hydrolase
MYVSETKLHVHRDLAVSKNTMVAAKHPFAVQAGLDMMSKGGNAIDAAVATGFAIGVVEPWMSGLGGVGFMTIQMADGQRVVVDYFGRAPGAATPGMFELEEGDSRTTVGFGGVKGEANAYGPLSIIVPGAVAGMCHALRRYGTMDLNEVLQPAIRFAEEGFPVDWLRGMLIASQQQTILRDPETARIFLENGTPPAPLFGQEPPRIKQPELAQTLRAIASGGQDAFYQGEIAQTIVDHVQRLGGILTVEDMASFKPVEVDPLVINYRDVELLLLPYQAGGVNTGEALSILSEMDLRSTGFNSAATLHRIAEASRRGYADRNAYIGDPDFVDTDWKRLNSEAYAAERRAEIDLSRATPVSPGSEISNTLGPSGNGIVRDEGCTTHFSVVDQEGNMVSVTQTLTLIFGSVVTVPGTGVIMNDSMNLFDPVPGRANSIEPGKRPASSMAHAIAVRDGVPILSVGAPGGRRIMDTCMQMVLDVVEFDIDIQAACEAPLIDYSSGVLLADEKIAASTRETLREMGHHVIPAEVTFAPRAFASPTGVQVDPESGLRYGGADPFGPGIAAGR